jgi:hypothetical protein
VVKALLDRPAIRIEMSPRNDEQKDVPALKKAALREKLQAADDEKYAALVRAEYLRETTPKIPPKEAPPKDAKGAAPKEVPWAEMEAFLLERVPVGEAELTALATRRSEQVKTYLVGHNLPAERVLVAAAAEPASGKTASSRVDFTLK